MDLEKKFYIKNYHGNKISEEVGQVDFISFVTDSMERDKIIADCIILTVYELQIKLNLLLNYLLKHL